MRKRIKETGKREGQSESEQKEPLDAFQGHVQPSQGHTRNTQKPLDQADVTQH